MHEVRTSKLTNHDKHHVPRLQAPVIRITLGERRDRARSIQSVSAKQDAVGFVKDAIRCHVATVADSAGHDIFSSKPMRRERRVSRPLET